MNVNISQTSAATSVVANVSSVDVGTECDLYDDEYCIKIDESVRDMYDNMDEQQLYNYLLSQGTHNINHQRRKLLHASIKC